MNDKEMFHKLASSGLTRRGFLKIIGATAGSAAVFGAMDAWNLAGASAQGMPPELGPGNGISVIVLGAGPAGLTSAYELVRQGYDVTVVEARDRVGGHVFTARRGYAETEYNGTTQVCDFDEGHWFDAGAWRIPFSHHAVLHYTKEFGIPLIPHKNINLNAFLYMEGVEGPLNATPVRLRQMRADMAGHTSELLAKAVDQNRLDGQITEDDAAMLIDYLVNYGFLSRSDLEYGPTRHRGWDVLPGAGMQPGQLSEPFAFQDLLPFASEAMGAAGFYIAATSAFDQQETMLQPVGGMSTIYEDGFAPALGERLHLNREVREIRQDQDGVRVVTHNTENGSTQELSADFCMCTIPLSVLQNIPADFSSDMTEAITQVAYFPVGKMGLQFSSRFWETEDQIYGGMSFTNNSQIGTIAYPDYNYQEQKGVVQAYYNFAGSAIEVSRLSPQERIELALREGSKIHPQMRDHFETGFSVAWHRAKYSLGGWADYSERTRELYYPRILEPDNRIVLAGGHSSYLTGWMEGAIQGAWIQLPKLTQRAQQMASRRAAGVS